MSRLHPLFFICTLCILAILMMEMAGCVSVQESPSTQLIPAITPSITAIARARSGTMDGFYQYLEGDIDYHAYFIKSSHFNVFLGDEVRNASAKDGENIGISGYYLPISPMQVLVVYTHKTSKDGVNTFTGNTSYFCVTPSCDKIYDEKNPGTILTWYEDSPRDVSASADQSGTLIYVTYLGGPDHSQVSSIKGIFPTVDTQWIQKENPPVGYRMKGEGGTSGDDRVIVIAYFKDGTEQTILDTYV